MTRVVRTLPSLAILAATVIIARGEPLSAQAYETYCLPQAQLFLGRVELGAWGDEVRTVVGTPLREVNDSSEDDGGVYRLIHLQYRNLVVDLGRDKVELLETSSPGVSLPSGIHVGMTIQEVGRRLGLPNPAQYLRGDTLAPITCEGERHSPDLSGLELIFARPRPNVERRLFKIRLIEHGP